MWGRKLGLTFYSLVFKENVEKIPYIWVQIATELYMWWVD